jgi:hypothetical protein
MDGPSLTMFVTMFVTFLAIYAAVLLAAAASFGLGAALWKTVKEVRRQIDARREAGLGDFEITPRKRVTRAEPTADPPAKSSRRRKRT